MLDNKLIENALALCGKTMDYIIVEYNCGFGYDGPDIRKGFSIEKFGWYLLSPEFIKKYCQRFNLIEEIVQDFGEAIYEYQSGNEEPLIKLLSKIKQYDTTRNTTMLTMTQ